MKDFEWNEKKNQWLQENRGISFEEIVYFIEHDGLLKNIEHPNKKLYPHQRMFVVRTDDYIFLVPYVEEQEYYFLKTIIPSRKAKRQYGMEEK
jgi:uncharacterized DUF497 family protein